MSQLHAFVLRFEINVFMNRFCFSHFLTNFAINSVFNLCLSDLLPLNYECSARMFNENHGRFQRDSLNVKTQMTSDMKCERVDPAKRRMLKEKFEVAESYLGRFIGNLLKYFTDERKVQGVRRRSLMLDVSFA